MANVPTGFTGPLPIAPAPLDAIVALGGKVSMIGVIKASSVPSNGLGLPIALRTPSMGTAGKNDTVTTATGTHGQLFPTGRS